MWPSLAGQSLGDSKMGGPLKSRALPWKKGIRMPAQNYTVLAGEQLAHSVGARPSLTRCNQSVAQVSRRLAGLVSAKRAAARGMFRPARVLTITPWKAKCVGK